MRKKLSEPEKLFFFAAIFFQWSLGGNFIGKVPWPFPNGPHPQKIFRLRDSCLEMRKNDEVPLLPKMGVDKYEKRRIQALKLEVRLEP